MTSGTPQERLRIALEMADLGASLVRTRLAREHPDWGEEDLDLAMGRWRRDRPGAPFGDYPGPRSSRAIRTEDA